MRNPQKSDVRRQKFETRERQTDPLLATRVSRLSTLTIYDLLGQQVRTLVMGEVSAGTHTDIWDGQDGAGREVASGVYFYRLEVVNRGIVETRRMILIR